jgi:hypothetical protein
VKKSKTGFWQQASRFCSKMVVYLSLLMVYGMLLITLALRELHLIFGSTALITAVAVTARVVVEDAALVVVLVEV